jgi:hypothetical protein
MWADIIKNEEVEAAVESSETDSVSEDDAYDRHSISTVETEYDDEYESLKLTRAPRTFSHPISEPETFGWVADSIEDTIKRFRLKRLKSANHGAYYYDAVYHYIWEHSGGSLKCPSASIASALRMANEIGEEPFLEQPNMFW